MTMFAKFAIAAVGLVALAGSANVASATQQKSTASNYECFTDDGYGRKRPCAQGFQQKRAEQGRDNCFTDDGYGRRKPCAANIKR
jgi:hypothetical protein